MTSLKKEAEAEKREKQEDPVAEPVAEEAEEAVIQKKLMKNSLKLDQLKIMKTTTTITSLKEEGEVSFQKET